MMVRIILLKGHSGFKYVCRNKLLLLSKDKAFVLKMSIGVVGSGMDHVKLL